MGKTENKALSVEEWEAESPFRLEFKGKTQKAFTSNQPSRLRLMFHLRIMPNKSAKSGCELKSAALSRGNGSRLRVL